ncbi:helix-turn-helix domain-containing protein [Enterococcus sp. AZ101]|uniref:helix-turn-helix domain-containing protein n=1 Tax=Enterococcus sp. AZ101 TaxID=2774742 RepID=UPI003D2B7032
MSYIKALKKLREAKQIKQKDMIPESNTHSAYSKIENGTNGLRLEQLENMFEVLEISPEEFFHMSYHDFGVDKVLRSIKKSIRNPHDTNLEKELLSNYYPVGISIENMKKTQLVYYVVLKNEFSTRRSDIPKLTPDEVNYICSLIHNTTYYTQYDYTIAMNSLKYMNEKQIDHIIDCMFPLQDIEERLPFVINTAFCILTNAITYFIYNMNYKKAWSYIEIADTLVQNTTGYYSKINLEYSKCVVKRFLEKDIKYIEQARYIIKVTRAIGDELTANALEEELNNLNTKADYYLDIDNYTSIPINE